MIAILTDFGTHDPYVGIMKGVILGINHHVQIVDLTHAVQPQAVRQGAFLLANSALYFPVGTVFLAVVDPGVGGGRRPVAVEAGGYRFVGPDNGLLSYAVRELGGGRAVALTEPDFRLPSVSYSFHGRDIFAPAAAYLSLGTPLEAFGAPVDDLVRLPPPLRARVGPIARGEIVHIDSFGNLESSLGPLYWRGNNTIELPAELAMGGASTVEASSVRVSLPSASMAPLGAVRHTYSDVDVGDLLAMISSAGYLEISRNHGSAQSATGAQIGDPVELILE